MIWWKKLKLWQRGGILVGVLHLLAYFTGFILFRQAFGYFVMFLEDPWLYLLMILGKILNTQYHLLEYPGDLLFFPLDLLIGTTFYMLIGALCGWIVGLGGKRNA